MADVGITGGEELAAARRRLDEAAAELQHDLNAGVERVAKEKVIPAIRRGAGRLPHQGGLSRLVAEQRWRTQQTADGVRVEPDGGMKELAEIDAGRVTHSVFGQKDVRVTQDVPAGFASDGVRQSEPEIRHAIETTMGQTARKVTRRP